MPLTQCENANTALSEIPWSLSKRLSIRRCCTFSWGAWTLAPSGSLALSSRCSPGNARLSWNYRDTVLARKRLVFLKFRDICPKVLLFPETIKVFARKCSLSWNHQDICPEVLVFPEIIELFARKCSSFLKPTRYKPGNACLFWNHWVVCPEVQVFPETVEVTPLCYGKESIEEC